MLDKRVLDALNEQIKNEMYSAYLYLAMAAYAESVPLHGFAHWMEKQAGEELEHAMKTYEHEQHVTALIHQLYELAGTVKDHATQSMLKWFIDEQVEEEKSAALIVEQLKMAGPSGHATIMMDRALAQR